MREVMIYSTLDAKLVPLRPRVPPRISMFVCGITPYKPSHIGHGRTMVFFDTAARFLDYLGYRVFYLQNVTDIEDKILREATEEGVEWNVISERNFAGYLREMQALGVDSVNFYARCTDYIPEIIAQIETLIAKGHAYESEGDVYYSVASFPAYGKLSGQRLEALEPGAHVEVNPKKRAPEDFALWKRERLGPRWPSPWGEGRPGWHIEDTAITVNVLGPSYDLHGGALELKFPHHEAEIAQAEAATGKSPLAAIWMHAGLLNMRGEKMSKSLGNVLSLGDALTMVRPEVLRFFFLSGHYRSPLDYAGPSSFEEANRAYETLEGSYHRLEDALAQRFPGTWTGPDGVARTFPGWKEWVAAVDATLPADPSKPGGDKVLESMESSMANDFSVREATASLYTWAGEVNVILGNNPEKVPLEPLVRALRPFRFAQKVLGFFPAKGGGASEQALGKLVEIALEARTRAKARKDFAEADRIRQELLAAGVLVEDTGGRARWRLKP